VNAENHKPNPIFAHFSWDERERLLRSGGSALAGPVAMRAELAVVRRCMHAIRAPHGRRRLHDGACSNAGSGLLHPRLACDRVTVAHLHLAAGHVFMPVANNFKPVVHDFMPVAGDFTPVAHDFMLVSSIRWSGPYPSVHWPKSGWWRSRSGRQWCELASRGSGYLFMPR
jgi:hypothetical protein